MSKIVIMIDAGHDINTAGKRALDGSMREFEFNKATALVLYQLLMMYENVEILFAHDMNDMIDQSLADRVKLANSNGVHLYISIHANAGVTSARGIETYIHPNAGIETYNIALAIHNQTIVITQQKNRGIKRSDFQVLEYTKMPAVLIECGFMTNEEDLKLLKSVHYRELCAHGIARGIAESFKLKKKIDIFVSKNPVAPPVTPVQTGIRYQVVTGSFADRENAEKRIAELKRKGYESFIEINKK